MNIVPVEDRVVLIRDEAVTKTEGGIIVPLQVIDNNKPCRGVVIAVGPGRWDHGQWIATTIKVGDVIWFPTHAGIQIEIDKREAVMLREPEVLVRRKREGE